MKRRIFVPLALISLLGLLIIQQSCVKEDFDKVPALHKQVSWAKTTTIAELKTIYKGTAGIIDSLADDTFWQTLATNEVTDSSLIIEGVVLSSDSAANFDETVTIMDETGGIDLKINASDLYLTYGLKPGKKVLVKVNGLAIDNYHGLFQIGLAYTDENTIKVKGIDPSEVSNHIQMSGEKVALEPVDINIDEIKNNEYLVQRLIKIDSVQFWNSITTYSLPGANTNRILVNANGDQLVLRTSGYAKFTNETVPSGSGSIVGVLSDYDGTYQLVIRDLNDVQFNNDRFGDQAPEKNTTIKQLKALCTSDLVLINENAVLECVVNANDESGNLYKEIFIEDETGGIQFDVNIKNLYADFPIGTKIRINCNGMHIGFYKGVFQLGGEYSNHIGQLSPSDFYNKVFPIETNVPITPVITNIDKLSDSLVGKIITLKNVEFLSSELGKIYAEISNYPTDRYLEDTTGNTIIVNTSSYADFASIQLPKYKGTITAVLSKYLDNYQLYIRSLKDVKMIYPRWRNGIYNQNFNSATINSRINFDGWQTQATTGSKYWVGKQFSGNNYAEMSAYQSGEASNISWLISPKITITSSIPTFLTFDTEFSYWESGTTLQVYISSDFDGSNIGTATWTELTDAYIVHKNDGYNKWINSGLVNLSNYSGDIYIGYKYTGSNSLTTRFRVDNFSVFTQE